MSTEYVAKALDRSALPQPAAIRDIDYEAVLQSRTDSLLARFASAGIEYDVENLETDPGIILQQEDAYREILTLGAINDGVKSVLVDYAFGSTLDHLARLLSNGAVIRVSGESDAAFRLRLRFAMEGLAAGGPAGRYISLALNACPDDLADATAITPQVGTGEVWVTLLGKTEPDPGITVRSAVRTALHAPDAKVLTDVVTVRPPVVTRTDWVVELTLLPNLSHASVQTEAQRRLEALKVALRYLGRNCRRSAISSAAFVEGVESVTVAEPAADIAVDDTGFVEVGTISVSIKGHDY